MASLDADKILVPDGSPNDGVQLVKSTSVGIRIVPEGLVLNLPTCTGTPSELLDGDLWVEDGDADNKALKYFDGTNTFSVQISKE